MVPWDGSMICTGHPGIGRRTSGADEHCMTGPRQRRLHRQEPGEPRSANLFLVTFDLLNSILLFFYKQVPHRQCSVEYAVVFYGGTAPSHIARPAKRSSTLKEHLGVSRSLLNTALFDTFC